MKKILYNSVSDLMEIGETLFCACDEDESGGKYEYFSNFMLKKFELNLLYFSCISVKLIISYSEILSRKIVNFVVFFHDLKEQKLTFCIKIPESKITFLGYIFMQYVVL